MQSWRTASSSPKALGGAFAGAAVTARACRTAATSTASAAPRLPERRRPTTLLTQRTLSSEAISECPVIAGGLGSREYRAGSRDVGEPAIRDPRDRPAG